MGNEFIFWSKEQEEVFKYLKTSLSGLSNEAALQRVRPEVENKSRFLKEVLLFVSQFKSPVTLLLIFALVLSSVLGEFLESVIIFGILFVSAILSFIQERRASKAFEKLRALLKSKAKVKRENTLLDIPIDQVVPGDIILLEAGDMVPSDSLILELKDLYVNESVLTGESFPSEKKVGVLPQDTPLSKRQNSVFKGTSVISGTAVVLAVVTGKETEIGKVESALVSMVKETAFERSIRQFGYMLMRVALVIVVIIMIINILSEKNTIDSILFALALAVGLTPEMLPAIVTITLSFGAKRLAQKKVIVKKLSSIQNLGSIDILCSDKTGTLTEGEVKIHSYVSPDGAENALIQKYAYLNAYFESGYPNPMDLAIREQSRTDISDYTKFDEVPYDFNRKRLSIVVENDNNHIMITKGALSNIMEISAHVLLGDSQVFPIEEHRDKILELFEEFSKKGLRTIGVCYKDVTGDPIINKDDENDMIFIGFILLFDPPRKDIKKVIAALKKQGVKLKIITGDNVLIAENIAARIGIPSRRIISGKALHELSDDAIVSRVDKVDIFAEIEPSQKERIVRALQKNGHVVGYLGDGINDASALKTADVGISVNTAVDVAKESADMILMEKELDVILEGISEGRKTHLNILKYIFITISANFGNMFSMGVGSVLLPFFPLLPSQILLTNFLTDIPALFLTSDNIDDELLKKPQRWNNRLIRDFMISFGLISSLFDFLTFGVLIWVFHAIGDSFRTAWFIESVITEILILLVIRTRRSFVKSKIGRMLLISSIIIIVIVLVIPYIPIFSIIGLVPLPLNILMAIFLIAILYFYVGEVTKKIFYKKMNY